MATRTGLAPASIQQNRYLRARMGISIDKIAQEDGVSQRTVEQSIERVGAFRQSKSVEFVNQAISEIILTSQDATNKVLTRALRAQIEERDEGTGQIRKGPDFEVQEIRALYVSPLRG